MVILRKILQCKFYVHRKIRIVLKLYVYLPLVLNSFALMLEYPHNGALDSQIVLHFVVELSRQHCVLQMHTVGENHPELLRHGLRIVCHTYVRNLHKPNKKSSSFRGMTMAS